MLMKFLYDIFSYASILKGINQSRKYLWGFHIGFPYECT